MERHDPSADANVRTVPGELRAYRLWRYAPSDFRSDEPVQLRALTWQTPLDPQIQLAGERYEATCTRNTDVHTIHYQRPTRVPAEECTCGFYGTIVGGMAYAFEMAGREPVVCAVRGPYIVGSVRLSGRLVIGVTGVVRAQYMRLEALFGITAWNGPGKKALAAVAEQYGVPAYVRPRPFEDAYPLDNVLDLVPGIHSRPILMAQSSAAVLRDAQIRAHRFNRDLRLCGCRDCFERAKDGDRFDAMGSQLASYAALVHRFKKEESLLSRWVNWQWNV